ncbi:MAG TPA: nitroreductase family deazaflavin-dependent oxidoreductase [Miltoncostaeaceae bacterium]|nr:nitroreductase family deazaflavin-dependent oxidoreductase [Miltoncostaeaceae bacterium]
MAASRPGSAFFRTTRIGAQDRLLHRLSGGRGTVTGVFAAFPTVFVTTTGARSGRPHTVPLIAVADPAKPGRIALIASNFGQAHDPDWCRNLRASPVATVLGREASSRYTAEEVAGAAYERWFDLGARIYLGYPSYRSRAGRHIPIFELTPLGTG